MNVHWMNTEAYLISAHSSWRRRDLLVITWENTHTHTHTHTHLHSHTHTYTHTLTHTHSHSHTHTHSHTHLHSHTHTYTHTHTHTVTHTHTHTHSHTHTHTPSTRQSPDISPGQSDNLISGNSITFVFMDLFRLFLLHLKYIKITDFCRDLSRPEY